MLSIWIIHRQAHERAALARIAGSADSTVMGSPHDGIFDSASAPDVVVLALSGDFEQELEFAHRMAQRIDAAAWILLAQDDDLAEARRLFDTLPTKFVRYPPSPALLRAHIRTALRHRVAAPLSRRRNTDALSKRFARWFADLELPELMRALDPKLGPAPILVWGEPGTGRGLLGHYVHAYASGSDEGFVHVACRHVESAGDLLAQIASLGGDKQASQQSYTIWLEDVELLPSGVQRQVQDWVEYGLPSGALRASSVRWIGSADDRTGLAYADLEGTESNGQLEADLALALSAVEIHIPPLRERSRSIEALAADTALEWCNSRGERLRVFSMESIQQLTQYPWPGNHRELESVVTRTLSHSSADPILPAHLHFAGGDSPPSFETDAESHLPDAEILPDTEALPAAEILPDAETPPDVEILPDAEILAGIDDALDAFDPSVASPPSESAIPSGGVDYAAPEPFADEINPHHEPDWPQLVRAVAHEIRNPLVSIRTYSELLPERYDDEEFREQFASLVSEDVQRIDDVVNRLQNLATIPDTKSEIVNIADLLDGLLEERREEIKSRRLLVLKELDREQPSAIVDAAQLRSALGGLVAKALALVPDHGDIYVASRHHASGLGGQPMLRILLRYNHRQASSAFSSGDSIIVEGMTLNDTSLEVVITERVVSAHGGSLVVDTSDGQETVVIVDLPAPATLQPPAHS